MSGQDIYQDQIAITVTNHWRQTFQRWESGHSPAQNWIPMRLNIYKDCWELEPTGAQDQLIVRKEFKREWQNPNWRNKSCPCFLLTISHVTFRICDSHKQTRQVSQLCNLTQEGCRTYSRIKSSSIVRTSIYVCYFLYCLWVPVGSDHVRLLPYGLALLMDRAVRGRCALAGFFPTPGEVKIPHLVPSDAFKMQGKALEFFQAWYSQAEDFFKSLFQECGFQPGGPVRRYRSHEATQQWTRFSHGNRSEPALLIAETLTRVHRNQWWRHRITGECLTWYHNHRSRINPSTDTRAGYTRPRLSPEHWLHHTKAFGYLAFGGNGLQSCTS